jgi:hypothetical protein
MPLEEVHFIREKYPNDNIIIVSERPVPIKVVPYIPRLRGLGRSTSPQYR